MPCDGVVQLYVYATAGRATIEFINHPEFLLLASDYTHTDHETLYLSVSKGMMFKYQRVCNYSGSSPYFGVRAVLFPYK